MKLLLILSTAVLIIYSCKKDPEDLILPEPTPTLATFEGDIGVNNNSTISSIDHNLLICGNTPSNLCILKISKTGSQIWRKDFTAGDGSSTSGLTESFNQDVFICGTTWRNVHQTRSDVLLIKTNSSGDTLWTKTYGGAKDDFGKYIISTNDGNLLICGTSHSSTSEPFSDIYLLKVNTEGDTLWTRTFVKKDQQMPYNLLQTQNGEYLVTGTNTDSTYIRKLFFLKVTADGLQTWSKIMDDDTERWGRSTAELSNGDLITCGIVKTGNLNQILLIKTDDQGNEIWEKDYGSAYVTEQANAIEINADGSYIITGGSFHENSGQTGIVLLKTDPDGEQLLMKEFGHMLIDYGQNIVKDDNDDNLITGEYNGRIFITRTDNNCVFK